MAPLSLKYQASPNIQQPENSPIEDEAFVGMWRDAPHLEDSSAWVRETRNALGPQAIMTILPHDASDEDILKVVREWVELLAQNRYEEAFALTGYASTDEWSPELLHLLTANYGDLEPRQDGETFEVTSLYDNPILPAGRKSSYQDVEWQPENRGCVGWVHFDLPLDGEWSDLTAVFKINQVTDGLALELQTIHVL